MVSNIGSNIQTQGQRKLRKVLDKEEDVAS